MSKNLISVLLLSITAIWVWWLNYVYQILMVKILSVENFADFASLMSIINILSVITAWLSFYTIKKLRKTNNHKEQKEIIYMIQKYGLLLWVISLWFYILLSPLISTYLKIQDIYLVLFAWSMLLLHISWVYQNAYYQSNGLFKVISFFQILNPCLRITTGIALIILWLKTYGAIWWIISSFYILYFLKFFHINHVLNKKLWKKIKLKYVKKKTFLSDLLSDKSEIINFIFWSLIFALFMNIDILIIKNIFDVETAGYYAMISVICKFLVFLWISIETVYYPQLVSKKNIPIKKIANISILYLILTISAILFFKLFWEFILNIFKSGLWTYNYIVTPMLIYYGIVSYLSIIIKTMVAFNINIINKILMSVILVMFIFIYKFWDSLQEIVYLFIVYSSLWLILSLITMIFFKKKKIK